MPNPSRPITPLKLLDREYTREDMNNLIRTVNKVIEALSTPGALIGTTLQLTALPTGGAELRANLPQGSVYMDGTNHLVMVYGETAFATPFFVRMTVAPITVSTS